MAIKFAPASAGVYKIEDTQTGVVQVFEDYNAWTVACVVEILRGKERLEEGITMILEDVEREAIQAADDFDDDIPGWP